MNKIAEHRQIDDMYKDDKTINTDYSGSLLDTLPSAVKTKLLDILAQMIAHDILKNIKTGDKTDV